MRKRTDSKPSGPDVLDAEQNWRAAERWCWIGSAIATLAFGVGSYVIMRLRISNGLVTKEDISNGLLLCGLVGLICFASTIPLGIRHRKAFVAWRRSQGISDVAAIQEYNRRYDL